MALHNYNWVPELNEIMPNIEHVKIQSSPGAKISNSQEKYLEGWTKDMAMKPTYLSTRKDGLVYFYVRKGYPPYITLCPIFGISGTHSVAFIAEYRHVYGRGLALFPNIELEFHPCCDENSRLTWVKIVNETRKTQGIKNLLKVEDIPETPLEILRLHQVRDDDLYSMHL